MIAKGHQGLGALAVAGLVLFAPLPETIGHSLQPAAAADPVDLTDGLLLPGASVDDLEVAAVQLAADLRAVPSGLDDAETCPAGDLAVSWQRPAGYLHGTHLEPVGPRPDSTTLDVNGVVVCTASHLAYFGFEAHREGRDWRLYPVPSAEPHTADLPTSDLTDVVVPRLGLVALEGRDLGPIDGYAAYEPQTSCDPTEKPGVRALAGLLLDAVPGSASFGITRDCDLGPTSEHKEGRAFDWAVAPSQRDQVEAILARLLAADGDGNPHALARRMGVMYIIWNGQIWSGYRAADGWRTYAGPDAHDDHVHLSLSWDGARGLTSLWQTGLHEGWWDLDEPPLARTPRPAPAPRRPVRSDEPVVIAGETPSPVSPDPPAVASPPRDSGDADPRPAGSSESGEAPDGEHAAPAPEPTPRAPADPVAAPDPLTVPDPAASPRPDDLPPSSGPYEPPSTDDPAPGTGTSPPADPEAPRPDELLPLAEETTAGTVEGGLADLATADGSAERLAEAVVAIPRPDTTISALVHTWRFDVPVDTTVVLELVATATDSGEGDDFLVTWSTGGSREMAAATVPAGDLGTRRTVALGAVQAGPVTLRIADADRTRGADAVDTVAVDRLVLVMVDPPDGQARPPEEVADDTPVTPAPPAGPKPLPPGQGAVPPGHEQTPPGLVDRAVPPGRPAPARARRARPIR